MKKLQIAIAIILIILAMLGCGKVIENPIENYNSRFGKFKFTQNQFGLQYFTGVDWVNCVKEGNYTEGVIFINCIYNTCGNYEYEVKKDTVFLYKPVEKDTTKIRTLKHTLILDKTQHNVFGIFQK